MRSIPRRKTLLALALLAAAPLARAGEADVVGASVDCNAESLCRVRVTVRHADEGWAHYANRWQVLTPGGEILATRVLRHPHVSEQPFTRGLDGVSIPPGVDHVRIRAGDSRHGFGGAELTVSIDRPPQPTRTGPEEPPTP
jgi:hypothetical protein